MATLLSIRRRLWERLAVIVENSHEINAVVEEIFENNDQERGTVDDTEAVKDEERRVKRAAGMVAQACRRHILGAVQYESAPARRRRELTDLELGTLKRIERGEADPKGVKSRTISQVVARLQRKGCVVRVPDSASIEITDKGRKILSQEASFAR